MAVLLPFAFAAEFWIEFGDLCKYGGSDLRVLVGVLPDKNVVVGAAVADPVDGEPVLEVAVGLPFEGPLVEVGVLHEGEFEH